MTVMDVAGRAAAGRTGALALAIGLVTAVAAHAPAAVAATTPSVEDLRALSLEELANVEVISVFKRPQTLSRTPASVYVITRDDIRRSGALTLPEVLRLAPNLMVARMNSRDYAIDRKSTRLNSRH